MACCGKLRDALRSASLTIPAERLPHEPITFEYVGQRSLTVFGRATGARYCFKQSGARVAVDRRDAPALAIVANLRRVP